MIEQIVRSKCDIQFDFEAFDQWDIPRTIGLGMGSNTQDVQDAVQEVTDQLKIKPSWWILEILPLTYIYQDDDGIWHFTRR
jgi:hypothetical protein